MGLTPLAFTGISSFSESFQSILDRAERVASIPLTRLQNEKTDLLQRKSLATALEGVVTAFSTSLENLASVGDRRGISGTSSNSSKVAVNSATATAAATYTISEITSLATAASETSISGYASASSTPVSATGVVRLTIGSSTYDINLTPAQNNLAGLRDAINNLGVGVTATVFTTGTGSNPNFLSLTANATGATTLSLKDDPAGANTNLLTASNQGTNAEFKLNGVAVSKASNTINDVVSGLTFTIAGTTAGSETVTLRLASDRSQLSTALQSLVSAYNEVVGFVDSQIGEAAGLLSGSSLVREVSEALRQLTHFEGTDSIKSLSDLGLVLDNRGKLSFDSKTFGDLSDAQLADAFDFVGTSATGLGSVVSRWEGLSDPVNGTVKLEQDQYGKTEDRLNSQIDLLATRINSQQQSLRERLQAADTLLASLESQRRLVEAQIESLNLTLYGKQDN